MLRLRIVSTLIGIPILIGLLFLGKISFFILIAILSLVGLVEFNSLSRKRAHLNIPVSLLGGLGFPILALLDGEAGIGKALILLVFLALTSQIFSERKFSSFDVSLTILGPIYVSLLLSHLILLQALGKDGPYFVLMVFFGTWAGDIAAYAGGRLIGRRKLAPRISPGKTWEGVAGALAAVALYALAWAIAVASACTDSGSPPLTPMDRMFVNLDRYGNTSAASVPIALAEAVNTGRIAIGDNICIVAFGAGFTSGAATILDRSASRISRRTGSRRRPAVAR